MTGANDQTLNDTPTGDPSRHSAGNKTKMRLLPGVRARAMFTGDNGEHRLTLERLLHPDTEDAAPFVLWIGMNPSAASHEEDDLTVRKEQVWTYKHLGFRRYIKMNFGTYRATQPSDLSKPGVVVCLEDANWALLYQHAALASRVILACGEPPKPLLPIARRLLSRLLETRIELSCLGVTKSGWPKHSSRLGYEVPPPGQRFIRFNQMPPL